MLLNIKSMNGPFDNKVDIGEPLGSQKPAWITILIGENGTKKSLLLRLVADVLSGQGYPKLHESRNVEIQCSEDFEVKQVIALSGTPLDRFPRIRLTVYRKAAKRRFAYFGQRASNGVASANQSAVSIVTAFLSHRDKLKKRSDDLSMVFAHVGLAPEVRVSFVMANPQSDSFAVLLETGDFDEFSTRFRDMSERFAETVLSQDTATESDRRDAKILFKNLEDEEFSRKAFDILTNLDEHEHYVLLSTTRIGVQRGSLPLAYWRMLLAAGVIAVSEVQFAPAPESGGQWPEGQSITGAHLSSGQWSWLSSFAGLAVEIDDASVILVDEPENSLHPTWQQSYVPTLIRIIEKYQRCHAIVATHAPLIASGLPPDCGNVRRLSRVLGEGGAIKIVATEAKNTFGWSASDTYEELFELESTRAKIFNGYGKRALELVREGHGPSDEVTHLQELLTAQRQNLPTLDPMRRVIADVLSSLDRVSGSDAGAGDKND